MSEKGGNKPKKPFSGKRRNSFGKKQDKHENTEKPRNEDSEAPRNEKKRKIEEVMLTEEEIAQAKRERSRKKWKKQEEKEKAKASADRTAKTENPIQFESASAQRKYLFSAIGQLPEAKKMTELEISEIKPPKGSFVRPKTEKWKLEETEQIVLELVESCEVSDAFLRAPTSPADPFGAPIVLILARTAVRCVELIKHLMPFRKHAHFASLFAKHKKMAEQIKFLSEWHCNIAIGTPNRVKDLIEEGSLKLDRLALVIVDMALDNKAVSILDSFETRTDFFNLYKSHFAPKLSKDGLKMTFF